MQDPVHISSAQTYSSTFNTVRTSTHVLLIVLVLARTYSSSIRTQAVSDGATVDRGVID